MFARPEPSQRHRPASPDLELNQASAAEALSRAGRALRASRAGVTRSCVGQTGWTMGCIVFSQYYDTTKWVGERLLQRFSTERPGEIVAVYAGAGKSGILIDGEWKSIERANRGVSLRNCK